MDIKKKIEVFLYIFFATETYITHFLEAARFPKAPVLAGRKVNFTLHPAKSADFQVERVPPTPHLTAFGP